MESVGQRGSSNALLLISVTDPTEREVSLHLQQEEDYCSTTQQELGKFFLGWQPSANEKPSQLRQ